MISNKAFKIALATLILTLLILQARSKVAKPQLISDIYGNVITNNDVKYPASTCCVVPTCQSPSQCYNTLSCGYLCGTGKYPPAEYKSTPGYGIRNSYTKHECRFGDCRYFQFTCTHCQDPREDNFSIYLVRQDCRDCYYQQFI